MASDRQAGIIQIEAKLQGNVGKEIWQFYENIMDNGKIIQSRGEYGETSNAKKPRSETSELHEYLGKDCEIRKVQLSDSSIIWTLSPHSYESLCNIENLYRTGVLEQAFKNDVNISGCNLNINLGNCGICMDEKQLRACKEELVISEPFLSSWNPSMQTISCPTREECITCIQRLAERHLLVASPLVAIYIEKYKSSFLKLGSVALQQYIDREKDVLKVAKKLGHSIEDTEGFLGIFTGIPYSNEVMFISEELKGWLAAYYTVQSHAEHRLECLQYPTIGTFLSDSPFHQCLVNLDVKFVNVLLRKLKSSGLTSHDVNALSFLLKTCPCITKDDTNKLDQRSGKFGNCIGVLMEACCHSSEWSLANMKLGPGELDEILATMQGRAGQVTSLLLPFNNLHGAGSHLGHLMVALPNLRRLNLCQTGLLAEDLAEMATAIGDTKMEMRDVFLHLNELHGGGFSVGKLMLALPRCQEWDLSMMGLTSGDILDIAKAIDQQTLDAEAVTLCSVPLRGTGLALGKMMMAFPKVRHWNMNQTGLTADDLVQLAETLSGKYLNVLRLDMQGNDLSGAGASVGGLMLCIPNCTVMALGFNGLDAEDIKELCQVVDGVLLAGAEIDLSGNCLTNGGSSVGRLLLALPNTKKWDLGWSALRSCDVVNMADTLQGKKLHEVQEVVIQGNNFGGAGLAVGKVMAALPWIRSWDLSSTQMEPYDFLLMARTVGEQSLKVRTLILDGSEENYGEEDQEIFSGVLPDCRIRYTNRSRGKIEDEMGTEEPVEELTVALALLIGQPRRILGLADLGCVVAGKGRVIRLDQHGQLLGNYYAYYTNKDIEGLILNESNLFMLQGHTISQIALANYSDQGQSENLKHYDVPGSCNYLVDGLAVDGSTFILVDFDEGILEYTLGAASYRVLYEIDEACGIARHMEGTEPTYFVPLYTMYTARSVFVFNTNWEHIRTIDVDGPPMTVSLTPEHTLLVLDGSVQEYSLYGVHLRDLGMDIEGLDISIQTRYVWILSNDDTVRRYVLYQYEFDDMD